MYIYVYIYIYIYIYIYTSHNVTCETMGCELVVLTCLLESLRLQDNSQQEMETAVWILSGTNRLKLCEELEVNVLLSDDCSFTVSMATRRRASPSAQSTAARTGTREGQLLREVRVLAGFCSPGAHAVPVRLANTHTTTCNTEPAWPMSGGKSALASEPGSLSPERVLLAGGGEDLNGQDDCCLHISDSSSLMACVFLCQLLLFITS